MVSIRRASLSSDNSYWISSCFSDFNQLDQEISEVRTNLKVKVNKLRDLENKDEIKGFSLNPLSKEEMKAVQQFI